MIASFLHALGNVLQGVEMLKRPRRVLVCQVRPDDVLFMRQADALQPGAIERLHNLTGALVVVLGPDMEVEGVLSHEGVRAWLSSALNERSEVEGARLELEEAAAQFLGLSVGLTAARDDEGVVGVHGLGRAWRRLSKASAELDDARAREGVARAEG